MSVAIQFTQNFLGVEPECGQVCKFVKDFRPDLLGVCTARIEVSCELVEVASYLTALGKQGGNGSQGFFSAAGNDNSALDLRIVQRTADESGQGEMMSFAVCSSSDFSVSVTRNLMMCVLLFGVSWRWIVLGLALTFVLFIEPPVVSDSSSVKLCKHDTPFFRTNGAK